MNKRQMGDLSYEKLNELIDSQIDDIDNLLEEGICRENETPQKELEIKVEVLGRMFASLLVVVGAMDDKIAIVKEELE